jgi:hypothetical protein
VIAAAARRAAPLVSLAGALAAAPPSWARAEAAAPAHDIAIDVRGPVALVQVTRTLAAEGDAAETLLDVALPDGAALVGVEVADGNRWRTVAPSDGARARDVYVGQLAARGATPAREPFDDGATARIRVARLAGDARAPVTVRYRFAALPELVAGRARLRIPASLERTPVPAAVAVTIRDVADVEIAGVRTAFARGGRVRATGRASTRSGWELSWAPREPPARDVVSLAGDAAWAPLGPAETAVAVSARARAARAVAPPASVLLIVDRSRSVGLPGLAGERDLARRLLEALPPATRFDALFFERGTARLFPASRTATREAMGALEAEMVPDRMSNGTDLPAALRDAGALLRREAAAFAPRTLVAIVTDGALPEGPDGAALEAALGVVPGVDVTVAAFIVRPRDDEAAPATAARALRGLAARRRGVLRQLRLDELDDAVAAALAVLACGGDVADVRLRVLGRPRGRQVDAHGLEHDVAAQLAPGDGRAGVTTLATAPTAPAFELVGTARGAPVRARLSAARVDVASMRALAGDARPARLFASDALVALVEPVVRAAPAPETPPKGSLDRTVVRNTLALAFTPRARACYLARSGATAASRDLSGRVRLSIDLARGEVGDVAVLASTLHNPVIEACLRDGAFAIEVPRALRSDAPVTAILNLVFRPRTPERPETPEDAALGAQIDLVIEELHRSEASVPDAAPSPDEAPTLDRSMIPTR